MYRAALCNKCQRSRQEASAMRFASQPKFFPRSLVSVMVICVTILTLIKVINQKMT